MKITKAQLHRVIQLINEQNKRGLRNVRSYGKPITDDTPLRTGYDDFDPDAISSFQPGDQVEILEDSPSHNRSGHVGVITSPTLPASPYDWVVTFDQPVEGNRLGWFYSDEMRKV
jgi:hypothetical protein